MLTGKRATEATGTRCDEEETCLGETGSLEEVTSENGSWDRDHAW